MILNAIVAVDETFGIGYQRKLLERISPDIKRFRKLTENKTVVMGSKTYQSLGNPLPNRLNIVISSKKLKREHPNVLVLTFQMFLDLLPKIKKMRPEEEMFIIGGG